MLDFGQGPFSYEGPEFRPADGTSPMIKQGGEWKTVEWQAALEYVAHGLSDIKSKT